MPKTAETIPEFQTWEAACKWAGLAAVTKPAPDEIRVYKWALAQELGTKGTVRLTALYADGRGYRDIIATYVGRDAVADANGRTWRVAGELKGEAWNKAVGFAPVWPTEPTLV